MPSFVRCFVSCWLLGSPRAASAWGAAANTFRCCHRGAAAPHPATVCPSLGIFSVTKKSLRNLCVGRGGQYVRPPSSGRIGTSACRLPSVARHPAGDEEVPARPLCGARLPIPSADAIRAQQHIIEPPTVRRQAYRRQGRKFPRGIYVGHGGQYLRASRSGRSCTSSCRPLSVARHLDGDEEVPARSLRVARRPIPSAVAIRSQQHIVLPPAVCPKASCQQ